MGRRRGPASVNTTPNTDKKARALELRSMGWTYRDIGKDLGVSHMTAYKWVEDEIKKIIVPAAEHLVKVEIGRYDRWLKRLEDELAAGGNPEKLVPVMVRVSKARRELMGMDQPVRVEAQVVETTQEDLALQELMREAKVKAALIQTEEQSTIEAGKE